MEQEPQFNEQTGEFESPQNTEGFNDQVLSDEERARMVTLTSGKKVILTPDKNPTKAFDPSTGEFIDISPEDIIENRA